MTPARRLPPALRALLVAVAVLAVLFVAGWAVVAVVFPPARVRAMVEARLSAALARPVRFEGAAISVWPPVRLRVRGLALAEPGGFEEGEVVTVKAVDLDLDVLALLARKVLVRRLTFDEPALHLALRPDGTTNLDGLMKPAAGASSGAPTPAPSTPDVAVREFAVRDGRVLVDDLRAGRRVALGLDTRLGFSAEGGGARIGADGETRISKVAFGPLAAPSLEALNQGLAKIEWRIAHRGTYDAAAQRLTLDRLALLFDRTAIEATGTIDRPGPRPALDLKVRGEGVDVAEVLRMVAVADARALHGVAGSGRLDFDLAVKGRPEPASPPPVAGTVTLRDAAFRYPGAPVGVEALSLTAHLAPDSVGVPDLACRVAGQPVRAQLSAQRLADPRVRFAVQGDLDLSAVGPMVAPKEVRLGGRAKVDVRGSGRAKDPASMALDGSARLEAVTLAHPRLPRPVERIDGELRFAGDKVAVRGLTMKAGKSSLALDATVTRPLALAAKPDSVPPAGVDFTLTSPHLDLAELLPPAGGGPSLPNAKGGGMVDIARFRNGALEARDVKATIQLTPGVMAVPSFTMGAYQGTVRGNARFDLRDPAKPAYAVNTRVERVSADELLSAWTPAKGLLQGNLDTNIELAGSGLTPQDLQRTLTAIGAAGVLNGTLGPTPALAAIAEAAKIPELKEIKFDDLKLPFRVEQGRVITNGARLIGPAGDWSATGSVGLDGTLDYAVSITLPPDVVARLGARSSLAAGVLADEQGRVLIDLKVGGNAKAPRVQLDRGAMADRLAGKASQALREQQRRIEEDLRRHVVTPVTPQTLTDPDSLERLGEQLRKVDTDSLRKLGRDLLKGFFGKPKAPAAAPAPAAPPDTSRR